MIMDEFMGQVERHMINLKKKQLSLMNDFKIEMFQARKNIEKNIIKKQFGITQSNLILDNLSIREKNKTQLIDAGQKTLSTNYNSRAVDSLMNDEHQISRYTNNYNKQNEDPNRGFKTDISVIQEFPIKNQFLNENSEFKIHNQLDNLRNDESMEMTTQQVKKKYFQKFKSASADWTFSTDPLRYNGQHRDSEQINPFCTEFHHDLQDSQNTEHFNMKKEDEIFGFGSIDNNNFQNSDTIQQTEECQEESQYCFK